MSLFGFDIFVLFKRTDLKGENPILEQDCSGHQSINPYKRISFSSKDIPFLRCHLTPPIVNTRS